MTPEPTPAPPSRFVDLSGLPEAVVEQVHKLVREARELCPAAPPLIQADPERWVASFRAFIASQPRREGVTMDDSRESIYGEYGE